MILIMRKEDLVKPSESIFLRDFSMQRCSNFRDG